MAVRAEGEAVEEGDLLFEVYSPELVNAQAEFLQALRSGRRELLEASRERLRALDIADKQIAEIEEAGKAQQYVKVYAPINGVVTALNVADGQFVKPETEIVTLADLAVVWLMSDVFEAKAGQVRMGATVQAQSKFEPGEIITGVVDYIYPDLDPITRTVPVRTVLQNPAERLKPGMFMTVEIEGPSRPETTVIPREALIRTGKQERVILALGDGRFQPAAVVSGMEAGGKIEILSGLNAGETVVASGQFLIDSESSFAGASLRLEAPEEETPLSEAEGVGTLNSVSEDGRSINLVHEPIDALGWPAMTMDMALAPDVRVGEMQPGADIRFTVGRNDEGMFVVTSINPTTEQHDHSKQEGDTTEKDDSDDQSHGHLSHRANNPDEHNGAGKSAPALVRAEGVLEDISASDGIVKLSHDPIPELGWPAMTMDLPVMESVDLAALNPGARVRFSIGRGEDGGYVIHQMEAAQ